MEAPTIDLTKVVRAFMNIREARAQLKSDYETKDEELKIGASKLEAVLLQHLNTTNTNSVRTDAGTFFRQVDVKPSCQDWEALNRWVAENDAWDVYERRLKKTFITAYQEAHDDNLPPGVSVHREYVVRVRKAN